MSAAADPTPIVSGLDLAASPNNFSKSTTTIEDSSAVMVLENTNKQPCVSNRESQQDEPISLSTSNNDNEVLTSTMSTTTNCVQTAQSTTPSSSSENEQRDESPTPTIVIPRLALPPNQSLAPQSHHNQANPTHLEQASLSPPSSLAPSTSTSLSSNRSNDSYTSTADLYSQPTTPVNSTPSSNNHLHSSPGNTQDKPISGRVFRHLTNYLSHVQSKKQQIQDAIEKEQLEKQQRAGYQPSQQNHRATILHQSVTSLPSELLSPTAQHVERLTTSTKQPHHEHVSPLVSSNSFVHNGSGVAFINGRRVVLNFQTNSPSRLQSPSFNASHSPLKPHNTSSYTSNSSSSSSSLDGKTKTQHSPTTTEPLNHSLNILHDVSLPKNNHDTKEVQTAQTSETKHGELTRESKTLAGKIDDKSNTVLPVVETIRILENTTDLKRFSSDSSQEAVSTVKTLGSFGSFLMPVQDNNRSDSTNTPKSHENSPVTNVDVFSVGALSSVVGIGSSITQHVGVVSTDDVISSKTPRKKAEGTTPRSTTATPRSTPRSQRTPRAPKSLFPSLSMTPRDKNSLLNTSIVSTYNTNHKTIPDTSDTPTVIQTQTPSNTTAKKVEMLLEHRNKNKSSPHRRIVSDSSKSSVIASLNISPRTPPPQKFERHISSPFTSEHHEDDFIEVVETFHEHHPIINKHLKDDKLSSSQSSTRSSVSSPIKPVPSSLSIYIPKLTPLKELMRNSSIILHGVRQGSIAFLDCVLDETNVNSIRDNSTGNSLLQVAIQHNQVEVVALMLSRFDIDLNHTNKIEGTALHTASTRGNCDILTLLLTVSSKTGIKKLDWSKRDVYGNAAIHLSAEIGDIKAVETQILLGVSPTLKKRDSGVTALHIAACKGYFDIVKLLLNFHTEPVTFANMRDDHGLTALMRSMLGVYVNDKMETDDFIEKYQPSYYPNSTMGSLEKFIRTHARNWKKHLTHHEREEYLKIWSFLLNDIDPSLCSITKTKSLGLNLFHMACMTNNIPFLTLCALTLPNEIFEKLYYEKDKHEGFTPLHLACWFNNVNSVELLLKIATESVEDIQQQKRNSNNRRRNTDTGIYGSDVHTDVDAMLLKKNSDSELIQSTYTSNSRMIMKRVGKISTKQVKEASSDNHESSPEDNTSQPNAHPKIVIPQLQVELIPGYVGTKSPSTATTPSPATSRSTFRKGLNKLSKMIKTPRRAAANPEESVQGFSQDQLIEQPERASKLSGIFKRKKSGVNLDDHEDITIFIKEKKKDPKLFRYSIDTPNNYGESPLYIALERLILILIEEQEIRDPLTQKKILETKKKIQKEMYEYAPLSPSSKSPLTISAASIYSSASTERSRYVSFRRMSTAQAGNFSMEKYWNAVLERVTSMDNIVRLLMISSKSSLKIKSVRSKDIKDMTVVALVSKVISEVEKLPDEGDKLSNLHSTISLNYSLFIKNGQ